MSKHKEKPARVLSRAERLMADRISESRIREAEYEATLDPRQKPHGNSRNSNLGNPDPRSQPWASNNANACHSKP